MKRLMRIVQETKTRWRVENSKGDVLVSDLMLNSKYQAEIFIKCYVSSYQNYRYEVVPLEKK